MVNKHETETETILFKYFKHLKICKYFYKSETAQQYCKDYEMKDISVILNNCGLSELEQTTIIYYGMQFKPPRPISRYYSIWKMALERITAEFIRHGVIQ